MTTTRSFRLSRRTVLRGACGAAIGLPWLEAMAPRGARAAAAPPKRFIVMFSPNGTQPLAPRTEKRTFALASIVLSLSVFLITSIAACNSPCHADSLFLISASLSPFAGSISVTLC